MDELEKREKVIKALEFCLMPPSREELDNDICSHDDCPYFREYDSGKCVSAVARDALAMLKEQEPRVMTMEEAETLERDMVIWFEHEESQEVRPRIINRAYNDGIVFTDGGEWRFVDDDYGERWRCWTSRPTDEQMEAVKWE